MTVTPMEFKTMCDLSTFRQKIVSSALYPGLLTAQLSGAEELIKKQLEKSSNKEYIDNLTEQLEGIQKAITEINEQGNDYDIINLRGVLETYLVYIDVEGTETERVAWLNHAIKSFVNVFETMSPSDVKGDFEKVIRDCKGDIDVTLSESFTDEMREAVDTTEFDRILNYFKIA